MPSPGNKVALNLAGAAAAPAPALLPLVAGAARAPAACTWPWKGGAMRPPPTLVVTAGEAARGGCPHRDSAGGGGHCTRRTHGRREGRCNVGGLRGLAAVGNANQPTTSRGHLQIALRRQVLLSAQRSRPVAPPASAGPSSSQVATASLVPPRHHHNTAGGHPPLWNLHHHRHNMVLVQLRRRQRHVMPVGGIATAIGRLQRQRCRGTRAPPPHSKARLRPRTTGDRRRARRGAACAARSGAGVAHAAPAGRHQQCGPPNPIPPVAP